MHRFFSRFLYGSVAYWVLNAALLLAEARWHILYRLTLWDIAQLKGVAPVLYQAIVHRVGGV